MTSNEIQKNLKNQFSKVVELVRAEVDELSMLVVPKLLNGEFLCGELTNDFSADGYRFIKNKYVSEIFTADNNETLAFYNKIYKFEKLIDGGKCPYNADNFRALFDLFVKNASVICVECNFDDAIDYYFGRVTDVKGNIATMKCFDGGGVVFKDEVKLNIDFVSMVSVGDRYTSVMSKYVNL